MNNTVIGSKQEVNNAVDFLILNCLLSQIENILTLVDNMINEDINNPETSRPLDPHTVRRIKALLLNEYEKQIKEARQKINLVKSNTKHFEEVKG